MASKPISVTARSLFIIDAAGTYILGVQGATVAEAKGLDLLGIAVVAICSALGGGIIRDILVGETPPEALRGWPLIVAALCGAATAFLANATVEQVPELPLLIIDALGLSLLAVAGAEKALEYKLTPMAAIMLAAVGGTGGSVIRDVLLAEIPAVLRVDFIATAALAGAAALVIARRAGAPQSVAAILGGLVCCGLRLGAIFGHWQLPKSIG